MTYKEVLDVVAYANSSLSWLELVDLDEKERNKPTQVTKQPQPKPQNGPVMSYSHLLKDKVQPQTTTQEEPKVVEAIKGPQLAPKPQRIPRKRGNRGSVVRKPRSHNYTTREA
ncbi:hypothetical protein Hamer_G030458 [Homarus americanus]|uniref:Uncharacterized protein n=1 Tax=Homarus americanus TaxID=6706 RepID=A0A8J5K6F3_HOMAM|nr:hypothetical protein Hamer_G028113 [Homarus americanus]KAG7169826.1 hypothetical protein Hamer_G030458 [Homarus americanus]